MTIDGRYELGEPLGVGSQASTFLVTRIEDGGRFVLKELRFDRVDSWKSLELFEREAELLRDLSHPQIPAFVDTFQWTEQGEAPRFFIVQEVVEGKSLQRRLDAGDIFDDAEAEALAVSMLDVLEYLHTRVPPIIHRDIKPANIIERAGGGYALVDFGGAQVVIAGDTGGSTVVGTTGYMPPEQLAGRARPQSDLYALGATIVHLRTGTHPRDMPTKRLKIDWRAAAGGSISPKLADFIDRLIEPVVEDRFDSAAAARAALRGSTTTALVSTPDAAIVPADLHAQMMTESRRILKLGHCTVFDFTPRQGGGAEGPGLVRVAAAALVGGVFLAVAFGWGVGVVVVAIAAILLRTIGRRDDAQERFLLFQNGRFRLERFDAKQGRSKEEDEEGTVRAVALRGRHIMVETSDRRLLQLGGQLPWNTMETLFNELEAELQAADLTRAGDAAPRLT